MGLCDTRGQSSKDSDSSEYLMAWFFKLREGIRLKVQNLDNHVSVPSQKVCTAWETALFSVV